MAKNTKADEKFAIAMSTIVSLTTSIYKKFEDSKIEDKRAIVSLIFSNLKLNNGELQFSLHSPFDKLTNLSSYNIWGERCNDFRTIDLNSILETANRIANYEFLIAV